MESTGRVDGGIKAGDSGNDIQMLEADFEAVEVKDFIRATVGGSTPDILQKMSQSDKTEARTFQRLQDMIQGIRVYHERNEKFIGPQSLAHIMEILERAWRIGHISKT